MQIGNQYRIPKINCHKGGSHQGEVINTLCLEKGCLNRGDFLLCAVCASHDHDQHQTFPTKIFLNDIISNLQGQEKHPKRFQNVFEDQRQQSLQKLNDIKTQVIDFIENLEQSINNLYSQLKESVIEKTYQFSQNDIQLLLDLLQNARHVDDVKEALKGMLNRVVLENGAISFVNQMTRDSLLKDFSHKNQDLLKLLNNLQTEIEKTFDKKDDWINNLALNANQSVAYFNKPQQNKINEYEFNYQNGNGDFEGEGEQEGRGQILKQTEINKDVIDLLTNFQFSEDFKNENLIVQRKNLLNPSYDGWDQHYRMQLLKPTLEASLPKIQHWSFKITEALPNWIGFGIVHKQQAQKHNYQYKKQDLSLTEVNVDHGMYILSSNGWAFASNRQPTRASFGLTKGDTVTLRFDPYMSILIFYKNGDYSEPFNLEFQSQCWNKLYPCVVLWYPGDKIELL